MISEKNYNRHIRKARAAAKGTRGTERVISITNYFNKSGHPHADFTCDQLMMDRVHNPQSDRDFAAKVMSEMAYLVAINEEVKA